MRMARVEASVVINRPLDEVFAFASNPENHEQWGSAMSGVVKTSEGPLAVGTTYRGVNRFLGQRIEWTCEVTEYQPDRKVEFWFAAGPLNVEESMAFEAVQGGTRITGVYEGEPGGFFKVAERIVVRMFQRQVEGDLANLKDVLEAEAEAAG
jgi:uncharacterized protein YndB with AHSA1/START domain